MTGRSTRPSTWAAAASILKEEEPSISNAETPDSAGTVYGPAPFEAALMEVEAGAAATAKAEAAGEAAVKLVLGEDRAG